MKLTVFRQLGTANSTPGVLEVNGIFQCYTLEPRADQSQGKPFCIPAGSYHVALEVSPKFTAKYGKPFVTPHILNVPGFDYIEIHRGNDEADTHGCTLVGETRHTDWVGNSELAFDALMARLNTAQDGITIDYVAPMPVTDPDLMM